MHVLYQFLIGVLINMQCSWYVVSMERVITPTELFLIQLYREYYVQHLDATDLPWLW